MTAHDPAAAAGLGVADRGRRPGRWSRGSWPTTRLITDQRDLDGDGLLWIIQPDETGLDASPDFRLRSGAGGPTARRASSRSCGATGALASTSRRCGEAGGPLVCSPLVNVLHGLSRLALGQPSITPALVDRLYDADSGLFGHLVWPEPSTPARGHLGGSVAAGSARPPRGDRPPAGGGAPARPRPFWLPVPPPSVSADEPTFSMKDTFSAFAATGAGPPGSTRPGWSGWACCAWDIAPRPTS